MKAILKNKFILLTNPTPSVKNSLHKSLSFTDKSKQYQLRRIRNSKYHQKKGLVRKLEAEVDQSIYKVVQNSWVIPSGCLDLITQHNIPVEDERRDTGYKVPLPWNKKPFALRDYQREAVDTMLDNYRGTVNLATGLGKTLVATYAIKETRKSTLVVVPSESIAIQFYESLCEAFGERKVGMYGGGKKKTAEITVGIAASVVRNLETFKELDLGLIIFDEVHHIAATTFFDISKSLGDVGRMYGLTATDYRGDGKDILITAGCGSTIIKRDIRWGVKNKWLATPRFFVREVDTFGTNFKSDKLKNYKAHVLNNSDMKKNIYNDIKAQIENNKIVLCLVAEVAHGEELSKQLGIPFAKGEDRKSQSYVDDLNSGKIKALIGTAGKISEGTDTKSVDVVILASFVAGKGAVIQSIGRGLRKYNGKDECLIFDYIPKGSDMLTRHAKMRIGYYKEITDDVTVIESLTSILKL